MEVHHHPEVPHAKKKHFKEYFLEFLMIFLAVTMGFIAENLREHLSDSAKENEYVTGMIKNLKVDTASLTTTINLNHKQLAGIDTLRSITKDKLSELKVQDSLYRYTTTYLFNINEFRNDDVTLSQLRNAGGYRLIRNEGVLDSLEVYEKNILEINEQLNYLTAGVTKSLDMAGAIFDLNAGRKFQAAPSSTPVLITNNKEVINGFYNKCFLISISLKGYNYMLELQRKFTAQLIAYLKKEYHVE